MEQQNQEPMRIDFATLNRESVFTETLLERNRQLMAAVGEIQQLRQRVSQLEGENADLKK